MGLAKLGSHENALLHAPEKYTGREYENRTMIMSRFEVKATEVSGSSHQFHSLSKEAKENAASDYLIPVRRAVDRPVQ